MNLHLIYIYIYIYITLKNKTKDFASSFQSTTAHHCSNLIKKIKKNKEQLCYYKPGAEFGSVVRF